MMISLFHHFYEDRFRDFCFSVNVGINVLFIYMQLIFSVSDNHTTPLIFFWLC